jgi:hypothetical protein
VFAFPFFFQRKKMMNWKIAPKLLVVLCLLAFVVACAGTKKTAEPVFKGAPKGSLDAEAKVDPSHITVWPLRSKAGPFQHPFTLSASTLEGLLQGLYFQKSATFRWKKAERVLNNPEAAALAQEIAPAFSSLGTDELIRFRLQGKDGETEGELFVAQDCLNFRMLTIQGYKFLKKGTKATSHQWKLTPHAGHGFFPSHAVVWNPKEITNWIVVRTSDLTSPGSEGQESAPGEQPLRDRIDVFP